MQAIRRLTRLALWLVLLVPAAAPAWAGAGSILVPGGAKPTTVNGLSLTLNCEWAAGTGYIPFRFDVRCTPPATTDRALAIELKGAAWPDRPNITVRGEIEIPAGSTKVSHVLTVPEFCFVQYLSLDVWENGRRLDGLSFEDQLLPTGGVTPWNSWTQGNSPSILFITPSALDITGLAFLTQPQLNVPTANNGALSSVTQVATFAEQAPADLVAGWLNYSSLDVIVVSLADLEGLVTTNPKAWQAVRRWTCAGGNLVVYGVGPDWSGLASVDRLLDCPAAAQEPGQLRRGWSSPFGDLKYWRGNTSSNLPADEAVEMPDGEDPADDEPVEGAEQKVAAVNPSLPKVPFLWRPAHLGMVVGMANPNPFVKANRDWQWVFNTISQGRFTWRFRHGVSLEQDNADFDNFLIGEVGLPPIRTYRVVITLFVVTIGPLNYWLLRRNGRLHLLLFTVPVAALLATTTLLGYALVSDGLEARLRARSYTELDQRRHEAVSWARLSYYTGLAPQGGLLFPDDTAVIPLERAPEWDSRRGRRRQLDWTPEQHLAAGWLASRTPTQYVTVRASSSPRELIIAPSEDRRNTSVKNELGAKIELLMLCDEAGTLHSGESIAPGANAPLLRLDDQVQRQAAISAMLNAFNQHPTAFPAQFASSEPATMGGLFPSIRAARNAWRNQAGFHSTSGSLLELALKDASMAVGGGKLRPRSYVAFVERPPDIVVGMDGLIETQSLHVIVGSW